jgi:hypothetical protein
MQAGTALNAVRILGVDIANLTMRVAVFQAVADEIMELAQHIDVTTWQDTTIGEGGTDPRMVTTVPLEQREFLERLLDAVDGLR